MHCSSILFILQKSLKSKNPWDRAGIQINRIFNIDIDIANFEKSILILILLDIAEQYIAKY